MFRTTFRFCAIETTEATETPETTETPKASFKNFGCEYKTNAVRVQPMGQPLQDFNVGKLGKRFLLEESLTKKAPNNIINTKMLSYAQPTRYKIKHATIYKA